MQVGVGVGVGVGVVVGVWEGSFGLSGVGGEGIAVSADNDGGNAAGEGSVPSPLADLKDEESAAAAAAAAPPTLPYEAFDTFGAVDWETSDPVGSTADMGVIGIVNAGFCSPIVVSVVSAAGAGSGKDSRAGSAAAGTDVVSGKVADAEPVGGGLGGTTGRDRQGATNEGATNDDTASSGGEETDHSLGQLLGGYALAE